MPDGLSFGIRGELCITLRHVRFAVSGKFGDGVERNASNGKPAAKCVTQGVKYDLPRGKSADIFIQTQCIDNIVKRGKDNAF